ncbi:MAG: M42 family metallopeptidase [Anaerolineales bacterium]|nr:M42 family metallopeptidase [Anaerolineales bacterium]
MKPLIKKLVHTPGPSGYESKIRDVIHDEIKTFVDESYVDALGNLIARKGSGDIDQSGAMETGNRHKIMLVAHMDEIGLIVTHVDENGFARFTTIGAVIPFLLPGGRVEFLNGSEGVIGLERLRRPRDVITIEQMFIDLGNTSRKDCPVRIGDVAVFERSFTELGDRLVSKAMDDRIGVAVLIKTIRQLETTPHEIYFVFSVQEEVGVRGATTAAFGINPDLGLAVDVTGTGDTPKGIKMEVRLGQGPAIKVRDGKMLADPRVVDWMVRTAEDARIPFQYEILERGSTDARAIQITRAGVPVGGLTIPCRYVHTPSEMVDYNDINNAVRLLIELLNQPVELI